MDGVDILLPLCGEGYILLGHRELAIRADSQSLRTDHPALEGIVLPRRHSVASGLLSAGQDISHVGRHIRNSCRRDSVARQIGNAVLPFVLIRCSVIIAVGFPGCRVGNHIGCICMFGFDLRCHFGVPSGEHIIGTGGIARLAVNHEFGRFNTGSQLRIALVRKNLRINHAVGVGHGILGIISNVYCENICQREIQITINAEQVRANFRFACIDNGNGRTALRHTINLIVDIISAYCRVRDRVDLRIIARVTANLHIA